MRGEMGSGVWVCCGRNSSRLARSALRARGTHQTLLRCLCAWLELAPGLCGLCGRLCRLGGLLGFVLSFCLSRRSLQADGNQNSRMRA